MKKLLALTDISTNWEDFNERVAYAGDTFLVYEMSRDDNEMHIDYHGEDVVIRLEDVQILGEAHCYYDPEYSRIVDESEVRRQYDFFSKESWFDKSFEQFAEENFVEENKCDLNILCSAINDRIRW